MKALISKFSSLFKIIIFLICTPLYTKSDEIIKFATGEYAPYVSQYIKGKGFVGEVITAALKQMGAKPKYSFVPWVRCERLLQEGKVWGIFPYSYTKERAKKYHYSDKITDSSTYFFYSKKHLKKKIAWDKIEDLKPYRIGGIPGYFYQKDFEKAGLNVLYYLNEKAAILQLTNGKVDLFPNNNLVGWHLIKETFPDNVNDFSVLDKPYQKSGLFVMISKKNTKSLDLLKKFNQALQKIRKNGTFDKIKKKYLK